MCLLVDLFVGEKESKKAGLLGEQQGLCTVSLFSLYQYLGHGALFSLEQTIYYICYILTAMMGGVLGVNILGDSVRNN